MWYSVNCHSWFKADFSLGMSHDGENSCDPNCCVMSRSIGSGKTAWSTCSVEEMKLFVSVND